MPPQARKDEDLAVGQCSHGKPCCGIGHGVSGPAVKASDDVFVNGHAAVRKADLGTHSGGKCCDKNEWEALQGSDTVFINQQPAHRQGDKTKHCGGSGQMAMGSPNVCVGDSAQAAAMREAAKTGQSLVQKCGGPS